MGNSVLAATAQQMAIRRQMDVIANNVANSNTLGFKGERMVFAQYLTDIGNGEKMAMVEIAAVVRDFTDGPLQATDNPLDVAIRGEGFFQVETPDGIRSTRRGNLRLDAAGALVTSDGHAVLSQRNTPLKILPGDREIIIATNGKISSESGEIGRLGIVTFDNLNSLRKLGNGLYESDEEPKPAKDATVVQGMVEGSNVKPIIEMTRMISLLRSYQGARTLDNEEHELSRRAITAIASVS